MQPLVTATTACTSHSRPNSNQTSALFPASAGDVPLVKVAPVVQHQTLRLFPSTSTRRKIRQSGQQAVSPSIRYDPLVSQSNLRPVESKHQSVDSPVFTTISPSPTKSNRTSYPKSTPTLVTLADVHTKTRKTIAYALQLYCRYPTEENAMNSTQARRRNTRPSPAKVLRRTDRTKRELRHPSERATRRQKQNTPYHREVNHKQTENVGTASLHKQSHFGTPPSILQQLLLQAPELQLRLYGPRVSKVMTTRKP